MNSIKGFSRLPLSSVFNRTLATRQVLSATPRLLSGPTATQRQATWLPAAQMHYSSTTKAGSISGPTRSVKLGLSKRTVSPDRPGQPLARSFVKAEVHSDASHSAQGTFATRASASTAETGKDANNIVTQQLLELRQQQRVQMEALQMLTKELQAARPASGFLARVWIHIGSGLLLPLATLAALGWLVWNFLFGPVERARLEKVWRAKYGSKEA